MEKNFWICNSILLTVYSFPTNWSSNYEDVSGVRSSTFINLVWPLDEFGEVIEIDGWKMFVEPRPSEFNKKLTRFFCYHDVFSEKLVSKFDKVFHSTKRVKYDNSGPKPMPFWGCNPEHFPGSSPIGVVHVALKLEPWEPITPNL